MLIQIKNAARAHGKSVVIPYSEIKFSIAAILKKEGFLEDAQRKTRKTGRRLYKNLELSIAYADGEPKVHDLKRISKVSRRVYMKKKNLYPTRGGFSVAVVSTAKGIMSDREARKAGVGGEVIAEVW